MEEKKYNLKGLDKIQLKRIIRELENKINPKNKIDKFYSFLEFMGELPKQRASPIILKRDNYSCRLCSSKDDVQVHHITPKVLGGRNTFDNMITLCYQCHHFIHHCNPMFKFRNNCKSHKELTKEGLKKARENGKKLGRKKT